MGVSSLVVKELVSHTDVVGSDSSRFKKINQIQEETRRECEDLYEGYKKSRSELKREIKISKDNCWKVLCRDFERDMWGQYRIVTNKIGKTVRIKPRIRLKATICRFGQRQIPSGIIRRQQQTLWNYSFLFSIMLISRPFISQPSDDSYFSVFACSSRKLSFYLLKLLKFLSIFQINALPSQQVIKLLKTRTLGASIIPTRLE